MAFIEDSNYTLSEVINQLKTEGYSEDFNLPNSCSEFQDDPGQFIIENTFRFDNQSDPDDQCVLYAVCCRKRNLKGILLNSYGVYNEPATTEVLKKIPVDYGAGTAPLVSEKFERRLDQHIDQTANI